MPTKSTRRHGRRRSTPPTHMLADKSTSGRRRRMLADYIKALPVTTDPKIAKKFHGKQGAYKLLNRHPSLRRKFQVVPIPQAAK
jgi:hypothetical protein